MKTIIDNTIRQYSDVLGVYALFSGGHDSLVATHIASQHPAFCGAIHIDTRTGLPETQRFVIETCEEHGWPLIIQRPYLPYESLLMKFGFPGPAMHGIMYARLKDRPLYQVQKAIKKLKNGGKKSHIIFISGVRSQESDRRAEIQTEPHKQGSRVWTPVISEFSASDVTRYIAEHGLKRSPVKDKIHMSGECFCGAFARTGEFQEIEFWYPLQAERIQRWQRLVEMVAENRQWEMDNNMTPADQAIDQKHCQWGWKGGVPQEQMAMPMCYFCREMEPA